jgi:hypothetical protein
MLTQNEDYPRTIKNAQGKMSKTQHVAMLSAAIKANLDARCEHDRRRERAAGKPVDFTMTSAGDLIGADDDWLYLDAVIADPIRKALRKQLKDLGWRLFRVLGTTDGMVKIAEKAARPRSKRWGYRMNIVDKAWDGIGESSKPWVA